MAIDPRTLAAAVLGVLLGGLFLAAPGAVLTAYRVGRAPDRSGEYGSDDQSGRLALIVRAVGVGLVVAGAYFGAVAAGLV
jgi:hypothetical protein